MEGTLMWALLMAESLGIMQLRFIDSQYSFWVRILGCAQLTKKLRLARKGTTDFFIPNISQNKIFQHKD